MNKNKRREPLRESGCPDIKDEDVRDVAAAVIWDGEGPGEEKVNPLSRWAI